MIVVPGKIVHTEADVLVGIGATEPLQTPPPNTRRMVVQVTAGSTLTVVRIREVGGAAGSGIVLILYESRVYGGADGAIAALEAENVAGPATAVAVQFEED